MKNVVFFGASGKSSIYIVDYLVQMIDSHNLKLMLCDRNTAVLDSSIQANAQIECVDLDISDVEKRQGLVKQADFVISMLPAFLHVEIAKDCLEFEKNLVTASYVSKEMKALKNQVLEKGLLFMNEIGVDPGLDHLSALNEIDQIKQKGAKLTRFETFTGGLLSPESDNNPLNYKFTWNPKYVVIAGSSGAVKFLQEGKHKYIPYHKLFRRTELIEIEDYGKFEAYANRDSLKYIDLYDLKDVQTMYRGTFRRPGFGKLWDVFVQLGVTDDNFIIEHSDQLTFREFINSFLKYHPTDSVEIKLKHYLKIDDDSEIMEKLRWLGIFEQTPITLKNATPAAILQYILEQKLKLEEQDKDMIVMWHKFVYELNGKIYDKETSLVCLGENQKYTAMAKTVGLPLAIYTRLYLEGKFDHIKGVHIPSFKEIYQPILEELKTYNIEFKEQESILENT